MTEQLTYNEVNTNRERYLIYPCYTRKDNKVSFNGYQLYDKDTEKMVYNHQRLDGLYNTEVNALMAAGLHQRQDF